MDDLAKLDTPNLLIACFWCSVYEKYVESRDIDGWKEEVAP